MKNYLYGDDLLKSKKGIYLKAGIVISIILFLIYFIFATEITSNMAIKNSIVSISDFMIVHFDGVNHYSKNAERLYHNGVFVGYIYGVMMFVSLMTSFIFAILFYNQYKAIQFSNKESIAKDSIGFFIVILFIIVCYRTIIFSGLDTDGEIIAIDKPQYTYIGSTVVAFTSNIMIPILFNSSLQYFFALKNYIKLLKVQ